jgi:citrate/tricarballylate utilization protein
MFRQNGLMVSMITTLSVAVVVLLAFVFQGPGVVFATHLGVVAGLFITMPYGKFVHAVYRYAALVRNAVEQSRGGS